MAQKDESDAKGRLQGTILKKCDRSNHHPDDSKACGARERGEQRGACQHTCEPSEIDTCRHAWTYRYSVPGGKQREESFPDELYDDGRPRLNSGRRKAQDRQLVLSIGKREQGRSFSDPRAGDEPFMQAAEEMIRTSTRIRSPLGSGSRDIYLRILRGDIKKAFAGKTLAQMATSAA
ncbi:MAG TPA: hypothetical protein VH478_08675, partial [Trebonia sp.]|nr:hypothetical protein [Trebonia sp.]